MKLFYNGPRLTLHLSAHGHCRRYFYMQSIPLAEGDCTSAPITLLSTTESGSVIGRIGSAQSQAYTPYGWCLPRLGSSLGYNGECLDEWLEGYHLGNGARFYSPQRMRFSSPDALSPFGKGGLNIYAYCKGDPCNYVDPSGLTPSAKKYYDSPPTLLAFTSEEVKRLGIFNSAAKRKLVPPKIITMVEQSLPQIRDDNARALDPANLPLWFHSSREKLISNNHKMPNPNVLRVEPAHGAIAATLPKKSAPSSSHDGVTERGYIQGFTGTTVSISSPLLGIMSLPNIRAARVRDARPASSSPGQ